MKVISETSGGSTGSSPVSKIVWVGESFVTAGSSGSVKLWSHKASLDDSFGSISEGSSRSDWISRSLGEHSFPCTDLIASSTILACASKSGVIFKWATPI
jgi:hypothetical protein